MAEYEALVERIAARYPRAGEGMRAYQRRWRFMRKLQGLDGEEDAGRADDALVALQDRIHLLTGLTMAGYDTAAEDGKTSSGYFTKMAATNMPCCWRELADGVARRSLTRDRFRTLLRMAERHVENADNFIHRVMCSPSGRRRV